MTRVVPTDLPMTIDNADARTSETFDVVDPATGAVAAQAPQAIVADVERALAGAVALDPAWTRDRDARAAALHAIADSVIAHTEDLAELVTLEMGKPLVESRWEAQATAAYFHYFADLRLPADVLRDDDELRVELLRRPVGPTVAITPWNGPLALMAFKVAPALAAGNPVLLKPSPYSPLSALLFGRLTREHLPVGALQVLTGTGELGRWLCEHPAVRKITFTGSIETGKQVARAAAGDLKRLTMELGGNDAVIALDDVDAEGFANAIVTAGFANAGQICIAPKRIYVPAGRYDEVVEAVTAAAGAITVGPGTDPTTTMGPVANARQLAHVQDLIDDSVAHGGRIVAGGGMPDATGYFHNPTVVADATDGTRLVDEEQFGPVLPLIRYTDLDEAVTRANDTMYGLGASVWSADPDRAEAVADRLEAGQTWINIHFANLGPEQPIVGIKWSGLGIECGPWGLDAFSDRQLRYVVKNGIGRTLMT